MAIRSIPQPGDLIHLGDFYLEDRRHPAVYFLYHRGEVVYVGQSRTLKLRIDEHIVEGVKTFDAIAFIRCTVDRLTEIESYYIRALAPKYNKCGIAAKARERASWKLPENRKGYRRAKFEGPPYKPGDKIELIAAEECVIDMRDVGEFLQVSDRDVAKWEKDGLLADNSLLGLLTFVAKNSRSVGAAQDRFEQL